ncbi:MAG: hypothetical protein QXS20_07890 [Candidatus Thorarchaeota archaeon]
MKPDELSCTAPVDDVASVRIVDLPRTRGLVSLVFRVVSKERPRIVFSRRMGRRLLVTNVKIADPTGQMTMALWNEDAAEVEVGSTYRLTAGYVRVRDECMILNRSRRGCLIRLTDMEIATADSPDISEPLFGKRRRVSMPLSVRLFDGTTGPAHGERSDQREF